MTRVVQGRFNEEMTLKEEYDLGIFKKCTMKFYMRRPHREL
jgi:hypothetical protein